MQTHTLCEIGYWHPPTATAAHSHRLAERRSDGYTTKMHKLGLVYQRGPGFQGPNVIACVVTVAAHAALIHTSPIHRKGQAIAYQVTSAPDEAWLFIRDSVMAELQSRSCYCHVWMRNPVLRNTWGHLLCRTKEQWQAAIGMQAGAITG